jgi:nitroreductase
LAQRRSIREFSDAPLTLMELGQLLWVAQGITHPAVLRTAPWARALYALKVHTATREGVYRYDPQGHQSIVAVRSDMRPALYTAALQQDTVANAPAVVIIAAAYAWMAQKYGKERGVRYIH